MLILLFKHLVKQTYLNLLQNGKILIHSWKQDY